MGLLGNCQMVLEGNDLNLERIKEEIKKRSTSTNDPYTRVILKIGKRERPICLSVTTDKENKQIIYDVGENERFSLENKKITSVGFLYAASAAA